MRANISGSTALRSVLTNVANIIAKAEETTTIRIERMIMAAGEILRSKIDTRVP